MHRLCLVLDETLAHLLVDGLAQSDLVLGLLEFFLQVLYFSLLRVQFLLKLHVVIAHAILLLL